MRGARQSGTLSHRRGWSTCATSSRSARRTFSPSTPCATRPSAWVGPSGARRTMASWSSLTRCGSRGPAHLAVPQSLSSGPGPQPRVLTPLLSPTLLLTAVRWGGQAGEAAPLDPGAPHGRQPQPDRGRGGPGGQVLPEADGTAIPQGELALARPDFPSASQAELLLREGLLAFFPRPNPRVPLTKRGLCAPTHPAWKLVGVKGCRRQRAWEPRGGGARGPGCAGRRSLWRADPSPAGTQLCGCHLPPLARLVSIGTVRSAS